MGMISEDWLVNLGDFLKYYDITPNMLLFFSAVLLVAFVFSLREFISWLSKTSQLRRDVNYLKHSINMMENKLDQLIALHLESSIKAGDEENFPFSKPLGKKPEPKKSFDISH